METFEAAYMAGVVDSDGSIFFHKRYKDYCPSLTVSTQSPKLIEWMTERWPDSYVENSNSAYRYKVYMKGLKGLLQDILPYMVIKRMQAELALEWFALGNACSPVAREVIRISRIEMAESCSTLNHALGIAYKTLGARPGGFAK